jgi:glucose-1-phosphate cytidylyltransferase
MKVVLFCGGLGTRLREHSDTLPKSLATVGARPIIWHLMRYYAHYGHREFILCLGYGGEMIREYFLNYNEALSNDFTLSEGGRRVDLHSRDLDNWRITFVDTGLHSNVGQRLLRVRRFVEHEDIFLANYADGLSDLPLDRLVENFRRRDALAICASMRSAQSFHCVHAGADGLVTGIGALSDEEIGINGGFFALRPGIFNYIREGEELVEQPFERLVQARKLATFRWPGFWQCMDTFKDKIMLDRMDARDDCPWKVWRRTAGLAAEPVAVATVADQQVPATVRAMATPVSRPAPAPCGLPRWDPGAAAGPLAPVPVRPTR